ncbi:MAG TPA: hypothetical protein PLV93_05825 [Microthrixaceae bacterium]|nr:hypothetical protein [Microthrixaceae bacterium]HNI34897.1 hypothetical protein [Microthrixaceae bacterium]
MDDRRRDLYRLSRRQSGLITVRHAQDVGYSDTAARRLAETDEWETLTDRVLRHRSSPTSDAQRLLAAVLDAGGDAAITDLPSASWWGLGGCSRWPIVLLTTRASRRRTELARTLEIRSLPPEWSVVHHGVPTVRPEMLALRLFAVCREERAIALVDQLWSRRLLSGRSVRRFLGQMGERGRNGTAGLRRYYNKRGDDYEPPASGLEGRVMQLLDDAGVPMRRQIDSGGEHWTGRVDFRHETLPVILEVQSEEYHASLTAKGHDAERRRRLEDDDGFAVEEIWDTDVWARPWKVAEAVRSAIARL